MDPDEQLVDQARKALEGDTAAFEELVRRHQGAVYANCRYLSRSPDDAEDLAQEVFVKAYHRLETFEGRSRFKTWLQRIKVNHCLNYLKRARSRTFVDISAPGVEQEEALRVAPRAHRDAAIGEERERIRDILDTMPEHMRVALVMCDVDGLSYDEIRETLGIGLSAVKMRIKRAREEFRSRYRSHVTPSPPEGAIKEDSL